MPRLAICTLLIVLTCWPSSLDGASLSLEDKLQQLADNYVSIFEFSSFFYRLFVINNFVSMMSFIGS